MTGYAYEVPTAAGGRIEAGRHDAGAGMCALGFGHTAGAYIPPTDVPAVVAGIAGALYEAIGKPPPIILERARSAVPGVSHSTVIGTLRCNAGAVEIERAGCVRGLSPETALEAAASLASYALAARDAGEAGVGKLARLIRERCTDGTADALARDILAAGYTPPGGEA